jgi:hypothetical protein
MPAQRLASYAKKLRKLCAENDTQFISYKDGTWRFFVERF